MQELTQQQQCGVGALLSILIASIFFIFLSSDLVMISSLSAQVCDGNVFLCERDDLLALPIFCRRYYISPIFHFLHSFNWFCLPSCGAVHPLLCRRHLDPARLTFRSRILTFCLDLILVGFFVVMRPDSNWLAVSLSRRSSRDLVVTKWMSVPVSGAVNKQAHPKLDLGRVRDHLSELICPPLNPTLSTLTQPAGLRPAPGWAGRGMDGGENEHLHLNGMFSLTRFHAFHLFGNDLVMCVSQRLLAALIFRRNLLLNASSSCLFFFVLGPGMTLGLAQRPHHCLFSVEVCERSLPLKDSLPCRIFQHASLTYPWKFLPS